MLANHIYICDLLKACAKDVFNCVIINYLNNNYQLINSKFATHVNISTTYIFTCPCNNINLIVTLTIVY